MDEPPAPAAMEKVVKNGVKSDEDIKWLEVKQLLGIFSSVYCTFSFLLVLWRNIENKGEIDQFAGGRRDSGVM